MSGILYATLTVCLLGLCLSGCGEATKSAAKQETTIETPGGKTTITTEKEVKTTGENPPAATP